MPALRSRNARLRAALVIALALGVLTASARDTPLVEINPAPPATMDDAPPDIRAEAVIVIDAPTGNVLFARNPDEKRPIASTQKLLTALLVIENGALDQPVTVAPEDTRVEPTKLDIKSGERYPRRQLLEGMLIKSGNDAAACLARDNAGSVAAFAAKMNDRARELGLQNSHFTNPNGLPCVDQYSSARDLATLARAAYYTPALRDIVSRPSISFAFNDGRKRTLRNTNRVLRNWPACNGMKTGYTRASGFCLVASASAGGMDRIAVVLHSTSTEVWKDAHKLLAWSLGLDRPQDPDTPLRPAGAPLATANP